MNVINLTATDRLREACGSDVDCGDDHFCDLSALDVNAQGECLPARFSLGPAGPASCSLLAQGQYDGVRGDLAWRNDRTVLGVFSQNCISGNIPVTDLISLNLDGAAIERIVENTGVDHGGCLNSVEQCYEAADCAIEIDNSWVSPSGQTVALVADSYTTQLKSEVWIVDSYGRGGKNVMTRSSEWDVRTVSVHPGDAR